MLIQHQKGIITATIQKKITFPSLPTATTKKPRYTFCHRRPAHFAFYKCKPTHYPQKFRPDACKHWQIQISKLYALI